jgi:hypothetical protein
MSYTLGPLLWLVDVWLELCLMLVDYLMGPLLWLVDVWLLVCQPSDGLFSGPPALAGGRVAGDVSICGCALA